MESRFWLKSVIRHPKTTNKLKVWPFSSKHFIVLSDISVDPGLFTALWTPDIHLHYRIITFRLRLQTSIHSAVLFHAFMHFPTGLFFFLVFPLRAANRWAVPFYFAPPVWLHWCQIICLKPYTSAFPIQFVRIPRTHIKEKGRGRSSSQPPYNTEEEQRPENNAEALNS